MTLDRRVKACVNQDGGTADGVFLQYVMHDLSSSHSYIEATSPPAFSDQQLVEFGIARTDWNKNLEAVG
jgi:hypothetical protein